MSVRKCKYKASLHAIGRLEERGWADDPKSSSVQARRYGVRSGDLAGIVPTPALYWFLSEKEEKGKIVVAYKGWVWVYSRNSDRLITAYELPDWLGADFEERFGEIEERKRKAWKKKKLERR